MAKVRNEVSDNVIKQQKSCVRSIYWWGRNKQTYSEYLIGQGGWVYVWGRVVIGREVRRVRDVTNSTHGPASQGCAKVNLQSVYMQGKQSQQWRRKEKWKWEWGRRWRANIDEDSWINNVLREEAKNVAIFWVVMSFLDRNPGGKQPSMLMWSEKQT